MEEDSKESSNSLTHSKESSTNDSASENTENEDLQQESSNSLTPSKESSTNDSVSENTENEDSRQTEDIDITEYLSKELNKLKQKIGGNMNLLNHFEKFITSVETSQFPRADEVLSDSSMAAAIHAPQDLPDSLISAENLNPSEVIYDIDAALRQASKKESNDISLQKTSDDESQSARAETKSGESPVSKGKEAASIKYRYRKGSKSEGSSIEALSQETQVEPSKEEPAKEASSAPEIKSMESQSSEADTTRTTPAVKRKALDSDESCSTGTSNLPGTCADDNAATQLAKKLKFDDGKASIQCPTVATLLSQTDQSSLGSEPMPSTSGLPMVVSYGSSSDESTVLRLIECIPSSEVEESSVTSGSTDATPSESIDSTSTNVSVDVSLDERPDSSIKSSSDFSEIFATSTSDEASLPNTDES